MSDKIGMSISAEWENNRVERVCVAFSEKLTKAQRRECAKFILDSAEVFTHDYDEVLDEGPK
jgi:hypothetical protein